MFSFYIYSNLLFQGIFATHSIGPDMAHQLYKLQRLMMNMYANRMAERLYPSETAQVSN